MRHVILAIVAMLVGSEASAGSRGYAAVVMDIGGENFFESSTYLKNLHAEFEPDARLIDCWNRQATGGARVAWTIRKTIPDGLSLALAREVWSGDKSASQKMQAILKKAKSPDGRNDVDGAFIVNARQGEISVMALGSRGPLNDLNPSKKVTISWNDKESSRGAAEFDFALCSVSKPLGFEFGP